MALNWVTVVDGRPLLLHGESFVETVDNVKCNLIIPAAPSPSGVSGGRKTLEGVGTMALTDQRVRVAGALVRPTLTTSPNGEQLIWTNPDFISSFKSLTIPLPSILSSQFEQPLFGANYLVIGVKPTPEGGLTDGTMLEIRFVGTGIFRFVSILEKTRERAIFMKRQLVGEEEHLPEYTSPSTSSASGPAPFADLPPSYDS